MSNYTLHKAETRGHFNYGWLDTWHTFSFSQYYDPERVNFGVLRVLNDDIIAGGTGFPSHSHEEMEIVSVPISGALAHKDSAGHQSIIGVNEIQNMSAGTGITHSEFNSSKDEPANFLQIWVLPGKQGVKPVYGQKRFDPAQRVNRFQTIVAPDDDAALPINQEAYFFLTNLENGFETSYTIKRKTNGVYVFVLEGEVTIDDQKLSRRDGLGISDTDEIQISAQSPAELLLIDVPMK
ncbi:MAG: pirin family protein [bacterium]|nr:pirin family protein [bacterium]